MNSILDFVFVRNRHVCPHCCCFFFDNVFRTLFQNPEKILAGLVKPGYQVLDVGPGQGYFSIPLAKMVKPSGHVIAIDIQEKMLEALRKRAVRAHVIDEITCRLVSDTNLGLDSEIDFALAFWMVHEVPDKMKFLKSVYASLKMGGTFLIVEPYLHVPNMQLEETRECSEGIGFKLISRPKVFFSRSMLLQK